MSTTMRTAIRFLGLVHSSVLSFRSGTIKNVAAAFTPQHFPKTLGLVAISGFCAGYKLMDSVYEAEVCVFRSLSSLEFTVASWAHNIQKHFTTSQERERTSRALTGIETAYGRKVTIRATRRGTVSSSGGLIDV